MLTAKQEKFALGVASGLSQSEAYRQAYDASKTTASVVHVKASELAANGKVAVRIAELRVPAQQHAAEAVKITAEMVARRAWEIASKRDNGPAVMALTLLAKMFPEFSEKHEFTGDVKLRVEALQAVASMTPEQMMLLAQQARET